MEKKEISIKIDMNDLGVISGIIQDKGDFQSIEQEGESLIIMAEVPADELENITKKLKEALNDTFSLEIINKKA